MPESPTVGEGEVPAAAAAAAAVEGEGVVAEWAPANEERGVEEGVSGFLARFRIIGAWPLGRAGAGAAGGIGVAASAGDGPDGGAAAGFSFCCFFGV